MSTGLTIRPEAPEDVEAVRTLVASAFGDEELALLLDDLRVSVAWLGLSFVAELDGEIIGHVADTRAWVDDPTALVTESIEALVGRTEPLLFLEGNPGFYSRLGFVPGEPLGFRSPSKRIPTGAFQVLPLPGRPGRVVGSLIYPDVWWRHDAVGLRPTP